MGIPGITREIIKKYPDVANDSVVLAGSESDRKVLCIDFNPLIYNAYNVVSAARTAGNLSSASISVAGVPTSSSVEDDIIKQVILELASLLDFYGHDSDDLYIAIDGTAPYAKIKQQRERRYKKAMYELLTGTSHVWDTSYIIPGTNFMNKLSSAISRFTSSLKRVCTFSDHNEPGEGEHKILQFLKTQKPAYNVVHVYSNDGDMLVLLNRNGISTSNVSIISDTDNSSSDIIKAYTSKYYTIDISRFSTLLLREISSMYLHGEYTVLTDSDSDSESDTPTNFCVSNQSVLDDFIFFMSLAGNDFVKPIVFTKMRDRDTFTLLITAYSEILNRRKHNMTVTTDTFVHVNYDYLLDFFVALAKVEKYKMQSMAVNVSKVMASPAKRATLGQERETLEHTFIYSRSHPLFPVYAQDFAYVYNASDDHQTRKDKYYNYFFSPTDSLKHVVQSYIRSMIFTFKYYTVSVPSWTYAYQYRVAPLPSDIVTVLRGMTPDEYAQLYVFDLGVVYPQSMQLMLALPKTKLAQDTQRKISASKRLTRVYPNLEDIHIDAVAEHKFIYCDPILPEFTPGDIMALSQLNAPRSK